MDKTIDLNDVCVFCYKCVDESCLRNNSERYLNVNVFCKFLSRICGKTFNVSTDASCKLLATCEDCANILESFNELYHQVECLKLQMEWRLDKLKNVMKCADKIPSRVKLFRIRYSIPSEQQRNGGCVDGDEYKQLRDTRTVIQLHVSKYLSNAFPHVRLETFRKFLGCEKNLETKSNPSQVARVPFNVDPLLEWLTTVIAVTMCCFPVVCYHHKASRSNSAALETSPELVCTSDNVSQPIATFIDLTELEVIETEVKCRDEIRFPDPPSPDNVEDTFPDSSVPSSPHVEIKAMKTASNMHLEPEEFLDIAHQTMEPNAEKFKDETCANLNAFARACPETVRKSHDCDPSLETTFNQTQLQVTRVTFNVVNNTLEEDIEETNARSNRVHLEPETPDPTHHHMETNVSKRQDDICTNLQVASNAEAASECGNDIPSTSRQLRSKFKCAICSLTFSTESRLKEHSQSCSKDYETDDEEDEGICKNDMSLHGSDNDLPMEEYSDSNDSPQDVSDNEPNVENKIIKTVSKKCAPMVSLTAAEFHHRIKDMNEDNATIPCPEEFCNRLFFTQGDLATHSKQHGIFRCNFCPVETIFAPDLALHELQHVSSSSSSVAKYKCSRCAHATNKKYRYLQQHLRKHLHMSPDTFTVACPVCLQNLKSSFLSEVKKNLTAHFFLKHSTVTESTNDESGYEFVCQVTNCGKKFEHKCDLDSHIVWHSTNSSENGFGGPVIDSERVEGVLFCDVCPKKYVSLSELNLHKKNRHNPNGTQKGSVVITDDGVTIDDLLDESNAMWPCPVTTCKLKFFTEADLTSHSKLHGSFKCKFCSVVKKFAPELAYHEISTHTRKTKSPKFICSRCDHKGSRYEFGINHHVRVHLNLQPDTVIISCPNCQQTFKGTILYKSNGSPRLEKGLKSSLVQHFYTHHDKSTLIDPASLFRCEHCPAYFLAQHQLLVHTQRMHPNPEHTSLSCADCGKQFRDRFHLLQHRTAVHHNNDESGYEFVCQIPNCSKRFEYECDLQRHTASHSKYSSNTCPKCGKVIFIKSNFDMHVKSHQGHVCEQCGKIFKHNCDLITHMLYHAGPDSWQFVCDICSVKCPTKEKLKEHKKIHSKTKPYICETCGATYAQRHNWRHHMIKKHGVADFTRKHTKTKNFATRKGTKQQVPSKRV